MLIAIFLIALLVIALAVAAPKMARSIQRDRDLETFHRGMQYRRAIQLYYRKFHAYPPNVEALVNTNDIRFLRKKYIDPMTGQDDWKPIAFGQNKTPTAMGFFGQPLAGNASTLAGIGPSGGGLQGTQTSGGSSNGGFSSGGFSSGSSDISNDQNTPTSGSGSTGNSSDNSGNSSGGAGSAGSSTTGGTSSATSSTSSTSGSSGPIIGGAGIIGFEPASPKQSILVYKKKNHYSDWEFLYDALADQMMMQGGGNLGTIGQPVGNPGGGIGIGGGAGIGGGSFGGGTGIGGGSTISPPGGTNPGGSSPTPPTTPQQ